MSSPTTARFGDYVRSVFGLKGAESVNVLTDIMPVVNLLEEAEHLHLLRDEHGFVIDVTCAAGGAGTYSAVHLGGCLPRSGEALVLFTDLFASKAAASDVAVQVSTATLLAAPASYIATDRRSVAPTRCSYATATGAAVPASPAIWTSVPAGLWTRLNSPVWVLAPDANACIRVIDGTTNEDLKVQAFGYTVPLHGSEEAS